MYHIRSHCKVEAIKYIREIIGSNVLGLKECKDLVEDPRAEEKIFSLFQAHIKG
jgi:ribosomal protein L7/L12